MNGYGVVKVHLTTRRTSGEKVESFCLSTFFLTGARFYRGLFEKFSQFFDCRQNGLLHRLITAPLHFCDLLIGQLLEVLEYQPAPLRIRHPCDGFM